ncbi:MAG: peptidoglycan DD-metalloendopeptidase family protein [Pseudomonadales bacterium]
MDWSKTFAFVVALTVVAAPASPAKEDQRAETQKALQAVVTRLNALDVWFSDAEEQRVRWLNDVLAKDKEVALISSAVDLARTALADVVTSLNELHSNHRQLQAQRTTQAKKVSEHLSAAYRLNGQDFVKLLLNQESPNTFDRMMRYHRYFSDARVSMLKDYQTTLNDLASNQSELEERLVEQRNRQTELAARQSALVAERDQRKGLIAELDAEVQDKSSQRDRLAADRQRLAQLLTELMRRTSELDGSQFLARKGSLPWPLHGPLRSSFGKPRADGRLVWHGMVVAADAGSPVTAVFRGRVIFADWLRGFGLLTIIDHGSGFMTLYGHADSLTKTVGELVESGEIVARAGRSGGQRTSGLYFEVRQKGTPRDPLGWLAKR